MCDSFRGEENTKQSKAVRHSNKRGRGNKTKVIVGFDRRGETRTHRLGVQGAVEATATVHVLAVLAVCLDAHGTNIVAGHVLALCRRKCQWQA